MTEEVSSKFKVFNCFFVVFSNYKGLWLRMREVLSLSLYQKQQAKVLSMDTEAQNQEPETTDNLNLVKTIGRRHNKLIWVIMPNAQSVTTFRNSYHSIAESNVTRNHW